jgi:hypothetical protein
MDKSLIIVIIILGILIIGGIIILVIYKLKKNGGGGGGGNPPSPIAGKNYVIEEHLDNTLNKPPTPYLSSFSGACRDFKNPDCLKSSNSINLGYPWCTPSWFAVKYVKVTNISGTGPDTVMTGNAGPISDWIGPIYACADSNELSSLCGPSGCSFPTGKQSCKFNTIRISCPANIIYGPTKDGLMLNLHMQEGKLNPNSDGVIIGALYPDSINGYTGSNNLAVLKNNKKMC